MTKPLLLLIFICLLGCEWREPSVEDIFVKFASSSKMFSADGVSTITISAYINPDTEKERRIVNFTTTGGSFENGKDGKISKEAGYENDSLVARVVLRAPMSADTITVTAEMAYSEIRRDYIPSVKKIIATTSVVKNLKLKTDAFSVYNNFDGSVTITATLSNINGRPVSRGEVVEFVDVFANNITTLVNGRFKQSRIQKSDDNSQVSVTYSPGLVTDKTDIIIKARALGDTSAKDEIRLTVREKL